MSDTLDAANAEGQQFVAGAEAEIPTDDRIVVDGVEISWDELREMTDPIMGDHCD